MLYTLLSVYFRIIRFIKSFFIFILWAVFFSFQSPRLPHTVWTSFDKIFSKCIYIIWYKCNRRSQKFINIFYGLEINSSKVNCNVFVEGSTLNRQQATKLHFALALPTWETLCGLSVALHQHFYAVSHTGTSKPPPTDPDKFTGSAICRDSHSHSANFMQRFPVILLIFERDSRSFCQLSEEICLRSANFRKRFAFVLPIVGYICVHSANCRKRFAFILPIVG